MLVVLIFHMNLLCSRLLILVRYVLFSLCRFCRKRVFIYGMAMRQENILTGISLGYKRLKNNGHYYF
jgi:hypothetical protein